MAEVAVTGINEALGEASDSNLLTPVFGAIGNLGDVRFLSTVDHYAADPRSEVREAAVHGLRRLDPRESAGLAERWLRSEDNPLVKRRLYRTLYEQTIDAGHAQPEAVVALAIEDLAAQPDFVTRKALIRIIGGAAETMPAARAALIAQIDHEVGAETSLLSQISDYLSGSDIRQAMNARTRGTNR